MIGRRQRPSVKKRGVDQTQKKEAISCPWLSSSEEKRGERKSFNIVRLLLESGRKEEGGGREETIPGPSQCE